MPAEPDFSEGIGLARRSDSGDVRTAERNGTFKVISNQWVSNQCSVILESKTW